MSFILRVVKHGNTVWAFDVYVSVLRQYDDQQDATIFYLFISSLLYMFRATLSPIIRST
jgi:hypothetical protein